MISIVKQVESALAEDIGTGDINALLLDDSQIAKAHVICRDHAVICGLDWVEQSFQQVDERVMIQYHVHEGDQVPPKTVLFDVEGTARALVTAERTALNFLQMLSATATQTQRYAQAIAHTKCKLLDTRKTIPGFRQAQKYAVRCGGGHNHRLGLYDAFLIKENHIIACGSIAAAAMAARELAPSKTLEIEVESLGELEQAIAAKVDIVMLDNFDLNTMRQAVVIANGDVQLEVSGDVTLETIADIAQTGVDFISVGAITKHIQAVDLSMRFMP